MNPTNPKRTAFNLLYSAWDVACMRLDTFLSTTRSRVLLCWQGCRVGKNFKTSGRCMFKARRSGSIRISDNVILLAGHRTNRVGMTQPVLLETFGEGCIEFGYCSAASSVVISSRSCVRIGKYVKIGGNTRIFDHDFHALDYLERRMEQDPNAVKTRPIDIKDDVFIGTQVIILKGVSIGEQAVVAAGSVVVRDIPAREIWGGNPARKLGDVPDPARLADA